MLQTPTAASHRFLEREWPAVDGAAGQHRVGQEAPSTYSGRCEASRWRDDNSRKTSELSVTTAPLATLDRQKLRRFTVAEFLWTVQQIVQ